MAYASRALQLAREACGAELEAPFLERLEQVPSNLPAIGNAARAYREYVLPARLDLIRVAAHHAIASLFEGNHQPRQVFSYRAENPAYDLHRSGRLSMAVGRTRIRSDITWNQGEFSFAVLHFGDNGLNAGVRQFLDQQAFSAMRDELRNAFERSDLTEVIRAMDRHFEHHNYTLWHLFRDEQRKILNQILQQPLQEVEEIYQRIYENQFPLLNFLREINIPAPRALVAPAEFYLNAHLKNLLDSDSPDSAGLKRLAEEMEKVSVTLDQTVLGLAAGRQLARQLKNLARAPGNLALLITLNETLEVLRALPLQLELWEAQNVLSDICREQAGGIGEAATQGEESARESLEQLRRLARNLGVGMV